MTITDLGTNLQGGYASGSGTSTLTWTPPLSTDGDLHILHVLSGRPIRYSPSSPTISDLAGWTPVYDVEWEDFPGFGWLRRSRAWIRYYASGDPDPSVTCAGMKSGVVWGGELTALRGPAGGLASMTLSQPPPSTDPWTATDPGATATQMNILVRNVPHVATTGSWTPDASWDGGHKREIAPPGSVYFAYREGPASAGTISLVSGGGANDLCHVLTIDMAPRRTGWAVGRLAW